MKISIINSLSNENISKYLFSNLVKEIKRQNSLCEIKEYQVFGCLEIPRIAKEVSSKKNCNIVVCLGIVLKYGSPMFEFMGNSIYHEILRLSSDSEVPILNGIIFAEKSEEAENLVNTYAEKLYEAISVILKTEESLMADK